MLSQVTGFLALYGTPGWSAGSLLQHPFPDIGFGEANQQMGASPPGTHGGILGGVQRAATSPHSWGSSLLLGGFPIISLSAWWSSPWWSYLKILFPLLWLQTKLLHKRWDQGFPGWHGHVRAWLVSSSACATCFGKI